MYKIISGIEKSKGISFIYSQFKWGGVYPLAIALEMLGYSNYGKKIYYQVVIILKRMVKNIY